MLAERTWARHYGSDEERIAAGLPPRPKVWFWIEAVIEDEDRDAGWSRHADVYGPEDRYRVWETESQAQAAANDATSELKLASTADAAYDGIAFAVRTGERPEWAVSAVLADGRWIAFAMTFEDKVRRALQMASDALEPALADDDEHVEPGSQLAAEIAAHKAVNEVLRDMQEGGKENR